jgi:hypothetical protein
MKRSCSVCELIEQQLSMRTSQKNDPYGYASKCIGHRDRLSRKTALRIGPAAPVSECPAARRPAMRMTPTREVPHRPMRSLSGGTSLGTRCSAERAEPLTYTPASWAAHLGALKERSVP